MAETGPDRPLLPWRKVAGIFLHCAVPFYLAATALTILWLDPSEPYVAAVLQRALSVSPVILARDAALAALSVSGAALLDPVLRASGRVNDSCLHGEQRDRSTGQIAQSDSGSGFG